MGNQRSKVRGQESDFPISASQHFSVSAFAFASQLWSEDFTAKLFCNVEFWIERLPQLIKPQPEFEQALKPVALNRVSA